MNIVCPRSTSNAAVCLILFLYVLLPGCATHPKAPDLGELYTRGAQYHGVESNPVIVIPGVLGSRLELENSDLVVWGAFSGEYANPSTPSGARLVALPMEKGVPLAGLSDNVKSVGSLDRLRLTLLGLPLELNAYVNILASLGVGGYRDEELGLAGAVDYGEDHFTCFQFHYDWRRSNVENARALSRFIRERKQYVEKEMEARYGAHGDVKFDIVAHSMGGLLTRYFLRYGEQSLPADGSLPDLNWEGAGLVDRVILVGTPNAGSCDVITKLRNGLPLGLIANFPATILGTHPSLYELLPRSRHGAFVEAENAEARLDVYDPAVWKRLGWGLADPAGSEVLADILADEPDPDARADIAMDHLSKCLANAKQFQAAMDLPATPPPGVELYLVAGDAEDTELVIGGDLESGKLKILQHGPGDGTVARYSALMDERQGNEWKPFLQSPIGWHHVTFIFEDHLGMTMDPMFTDNVLYLLLESPK